MAHDLRTPFGNLLGQTEVALGKARSADYYEVLLASNFEEFQRLSRMMDNMLFLAWSERSEATIERSSLNLASMFELVTDYFEVLAAERNLRFEANGDGTIGVDTARQGSAQSSRLGLSIVRPS